MFDQLPLSAFARSLKPILGAVATRVRSLHAERQAGVEPFGQPTDLAEKVLSNTLNRLRGGNIDDGWWRSLLNSIGQQFITPEFLKETALQEWLDEAETADDLKVLAKGRIRGADQNCSEVRERLAQSYSRRTGEAAPLANEPIDIVVAVLAAGYIASVPPPQRPVVGLVQNLSGHMDERFDHLEESLRQATTDPITQRTHTKKTDQELKQILILRTLDPLRARQNIQELQGRVGDEGDLSAASISTKKRVLYWAARLYAGDAETLANARQLRNELEQTDPDTDFSIVDALLAEADGDENMALRLLRDLDDSDSRTALFGVLVRSRGERAALAWYADQTATDDGQFFTAAGWRNWAVCMAKVGKWKEAAQGLLCFESDWQTMPALALVEGVINAAMLLPDDHRERALYVVPIYQDVTPNLVNKAENYHSRAATCFESAEQNLKDVADHNLERFIASWRLWIRLMDPNTAKGKIVRDEICKRMESGAEAVNLMQFAWAFDIPFDLKPLRAHLEHRKQLGGLNDDELLAECLLSEKTMKPRDFVSYLEQHSARLVEMMPVESVTAMHIEALVRDGQTERAHTIAEGRAADLGEAQSNRLNVLIDAHEGNDPRKQLELLYRQTNDLIDLKNLVSYLKRVEDRTALRPLIRDLFGRERTVENAQDLVKCFAGSSFFDYKAIIDFLEANPDILGRSDDLKAVKAWALFRAGRLKDSKEINDVQLSRRANQDDFHLDVNIALSGGDWGRVPAIVDREWTRRESHDAETLMTLAQLAGQHRHTSDRAIKLSKLAVEKAPDDPQILATAYWLHFQLGRDDEADPNWLARASELSSTDNGPLWRVSLQDVVAEWIPKRRDHLREVERKWLNGEIPTTLAASVFNKSLTRLLLHIPDQNASELDGRRRVILPIIVGGRKPIELQDNWTIGLDVTSVMVLTYLGLLEESVDAFHHIKLAPDLMECLFLERNEVRFHQPSRIKAAKRVLELRSREQIRAAKNLATPPAAITDEVGLELAVLLQLARHDKGKVICVFPIHRVGSLMEQQADTSEYDDLILSTMDICTLCHDEGKIDAAAYQRASLFLNKQGQSAKAHLPPSILNGPIYIDRLALSYLQNASILQPMAAAGLDIRIHPDVLGEVNELIEAGDVGDELVTKIERIRNVLGNALDSGAASLLPRTADQDERSQIRESRFQTTASLLANNAGCDALCIDDRFINSHPFQAEPKGRSVPIVCVLDVLRYLVTRGCIDVVDQWTARHKLRQAGFAFIPIEFHELVHWLKAAKVNNRQLTESAELRVLRQTMARIDSLGLATPKETITLSSVSTGVPGTCKDAVENLWRDSALTIERATLLSDWVWRHLWAAPFLEHHHVSAGAYTDRIRELLSMRLEHLLLPTVIQPHDRRAHYIDWIERSVEPLQLSNLDIIEKALTSACEAISALDDNRAYGYLFLDNLPETLRNIVLNHDPEFGRRFGFKNQRIFSIGTNLKLADSEFFAAAREVLATNEARSVQDIVLKKASVGLDMEDQNIVVTWSDADGVSHREALPQLALFSTTPELRITTLRSLMERFGPTAPDFQELLKNMETREANDQEISAIFKESANGIAALQSRLIQKINSGSFSAVDVIPQSVSYFERFVGPAPDTREPESYFKEVLVPHRKALLSSNINVGLDICCLGALRDDLAPGQWVTAIEDDAVWHALSSCHAESNPFSLLGALDVALYRQQDRRFLEFSATAVATLLDGRFGQQDGPDIYELLQVFADFVLNRINSLEDGPHYPGYWKRLCAWIQAGLIVRALTGASFPIDNSRLQEWTHGNMDAAGNFAGYIDARTEPLFFAGNMTPQTLRNEILRRLYILKSRHESEGRQVPQSRDIEHQLALPGPLEGHKRPTEPVPQEVTEELKAASTDSAELSPMPLLVTASQLFALGRPELDRTLHSVKKIEENNAPTDLRENLKQLELASIVAAATRDPMLANGIAEAVVSVASRTSEEEDVELILRVMLRAAAAYEAHDVWCKWLEEQLASIATHLPPPPNECLRMFLDRLDELERALPIESWFHVRAKSQAAAGAA